MTRESLKLNTRKALATMARRHGIDRWHSMRKAELVTALLHVSSSQGKGNSKSSKRIDRSKPAERAAGLPDQRSTVSKNGNPSRRGGNGASSASAAGSIGLHARSRHTRAIAKRATGTNLRRDLAAIEQSGAGGVPARDRLIAMVRDPFWLHAHWEISRGTTRRAAVALGADWHRSIPVLRLIALSGEGKSSVESVVRDIEIHGGVNHWYLPVDGAPRSYRLQIGYRAPEGRFFALTKSNVVRTPGSGAPNAVEENWSDVEQNYQRILALSGEHGEGPVRSQLQEFLDDRLQARGTSRTTPAQLGLRRQDQNPVDLEVQVELIIRGSVQPDAELTVQGIPVALRADGSFTLRMGLEEGRQLIPAVATSCDGMQQRTLLLAVERNTKELASELPDDK